VPELWNPVTGEHKLKAEYSEKDGRTFVRLGFAPCGSWFLVFRKAAPHAVVVEAAFSELISTQELSGGWTVHFDPKWGGPETAQFDSLVSWTTRPEPGIKFYSGTATYEKTFDWKQEGASAGKKIFLDLGSVRELAEVKVNGKSCGILWCPPWRVDVTDALQAGENKLTVEVVNFWPNRIIGDAGLPPDQRLTQTNIRELTAKTPLPESGLFGPVKLVAVH